MKSNAKTKKVVAKKSTPVAKTASKKIVKATKPVAKTTAKTAVKPAAKKAAPAPVKAKAAPKSVKSVKQTIKAAPKAVAKPAAKKAAPAPVKAKATPKIVKSVKQTIKAEPKAVAKIEAKPAKTTKATPVAAQPVIVKMAGNQNVPVKSSMIIAVRPQPMAQKDAVSQAAAMSRPLYRPTQAIANNGKPATAPAATAQPVRQMAPISKADEKVEFKKGDYVVYPAHGVGEIEAVETQTIGGMEIKLYAIVFEKDRMRLKVPVFKAHASGLRRLSSANRMQDALKTLQGRAQIRRAMWSRRAQEYETKINSGDPVSIAEVLRDLKRSNDDTEQSYSERQIYQSALERLAREVAAVDKISELEAAERLENMIKGRRARAAAKDDVSDVKEEAVA